MSWWSADFGLKKERSQLASAACLALVHVLLTPLRLFPSLETRENRYLVWAKNYKLNIENKGLRVRQLQVKHMYKPFSWGMCTDTQRDHVAR